MRPEYGPLPSLKGSEVWGHVTTPRLDLKPPAYVDRHLPVVGQGLPVVGPVPRLRGKRGLAFGGG